MHSKSRIRTNPDVVARRLAAPQGAVLLHLETGAYHGLNMIGLIVWELVDGERSVSELVDGVRRQVDESAGTNIENDVKAFLQSALERDLIQLVE